MGQLGELFPGVKLDRETPEEEGSGQGFAPGPIDLESGVIKLRPQAPRPAKTEEPGEPEA